MAWDLVRRARGVQANAEEFQQILEADRTRIDAALDETERSGREHGVTYCWVDGKPMATRLQRGLEDVIVLRACPIDAHGTGTLHTHPAEPQNPTLSLLDQQAAFFSPEEKAQAVVGRESAEIMLSPRAPGLASLRGKITTKALELAVRRGVVDEVRATELVKTMFPSLFVKLDRA